MASTHRETQDNKILRAVTEMDEGAATSRKKLKAVFLETDKMQMSSYIKDLEKTLGINKEIIGELIKPSAAKDGLKKTTELLSAENTELLAQVKKANKQRDDYQTKLLISEQILEDYKSKEFDLDQMFNEKVQEYIDQLNRKEYIIQIYEKKFHRALNILKKYESTDFDVRLFFRDIALKELDIKNITNVVEANEALEKGLKAARGRIAELERRFTELANTTADEKIPVKNFKMDSPSRRLAKKQAPSNLYATSPQSSPIVTNTNGEITFSSTINDAFTHLNANKEKITLKMKALEAENGALQALNNELRSEVANLQDEMILLKRNQKKQRRTSIQEAEIAPESAVHVQYRQSIANMGSNHLEIKFRNSLKGMIIVSGGCVNDMSSIRDDFDIPIPGSKDFK